MGILKRLALAMVMMAAVMSLVYLGGDPRPAPAATRAEQPETGSPLGPAALGPRAPDPAAAERATEPRMRARQADPARAQPQGPAVYPRPPASLDGVKLTPGRWVMPMKPRAYRVGCGYACYVSDSGLPHTGQDFPAAEGTPVRSVGAGLVIRSESIYLTDGEKHYCPTRPICGQNWTSYGNFVEIQDAADPTLTVWYAHLATRAVSAGQRVATGQPIGSSGNVGNSEGPHLHFEIRRTDRAEDPMPILRSRGAVPQPGAVPTQPLPPPAAPAPSPAPAVP